MKAVTGVLFAVVAINFFGYIECKKCEVCVDVLTNFQKNYQSVLPDIEKSIKAFKEYCPGLTKKKQKDVCADMGGLETSASSILKNVLTPLGYGKPPEKICEEIGKISDICNVKYKEFVDLEKVDLNKLKVKQLKDILREWGESCEGCLEKKEYLDLVKKLMPKYLKEQERAPEEL